MCLFAGGGAFGKPDDNLLAMLARSITHHLLELVEDEPKNRKRRAARHG